LAFHSFQDLHAELLRGVGILRRSRALADRSRVRGLIFDVATQTAAVVVA
jgi:hypothetical protein